MTTSIESRVAHATLKRILLFGWLTAFDYSWLQSLDHETGKICASSQMRCVLNGNGRSAMVSPNIWPTKWVK